MNRTSLWLSVLTVAGLTAGGLLLWQHFNPPAKPRSDLGGVTNAVPVLVGPTNRMATNAVKAIARMDLAAARARWPGWLNSPQRDPFEIKTPPPPRKATPETPVSRFQLLAIWLQTGGRFAVIDQRVYGEGDPLAEYRILRINADEVVVRGGDRTEKITFTSYVPQRQVPSGSGTNLIEQWLGPEKEKLF